MSICQSTLFSMLVTAGLVAAAIDTAGGGPGAVQVITVQLEANATANSKALRPIIGLLNEYAPRSRVQVLEQTESGGQPGDILILVRHPNLDYLEVANDRIHGSVQWSDAIQDLELIGYSLNTTAVLLDRTPD